MALPDFIPVEDPEATIRAAWMAIFAGRRSARGFLIRETYEDTLHGILTCYSEGREYHDLTHIAFGLKFLYAFQETYNLPKRTFEILVLAWLFHDIRYTTDATAKDNERLSAERCRAFMASGLYTWAEASIAYDLIIHSKNHAGGPRENPLWQMFNDADLAVFGGGPVLYFTYCRGVWREYSHVGREAYTTHRIAFLEKFREGADTMFLTLDMEGFGDRARANINAEIDLLVNSPSVIFGD